MTTAVALAQLGNSGVNFRNRIINGDMRIAQRGTVTGAGIDTFGACDRWKHWAADGGESGRSTISQSTDVPAGQPFSNSVKVQVTTAQTSISAGHGYKLVQRIEANNVMDLGFGTTGSKQFTVSFWAKVETKTGIYCVSIWAYEAGTQYRQQVREVTLGTTWQYYTLTFTVDANAQLAAGTGIGLELGFTLMAGSGIRSGVTTDTWANGSSAAATTNNQVNFYDSTSNALYVTGVQLEPGNQATAFEVRPYGTELQLCQRYFWSGRGAMATGHYLMYNISYTDWLGNFGSFPVTMRATPTMSFTGGSGTNCSSVSVTAQSPDSFSHKTSGGGTGQVGSFGGATYSASSEL